MEKQQIQYDAARFPNFKEYLWFKQQEKELMQRYYGRYIVIKEEKVIGDYGTWRLAVQQTIRHHKPGTFVIQHCLEKDPRWAPRLQGRQIVTVYGK